MKNNIYTAIPDWFNKLQSQSTDNTSTTTTQTTIIGGGGGISMSVHNLFIKSDTTITIDDFTISDLFVTDQITDTENWLTTPLLHTLPNTEVSVTTAAQQLYIGAYDKNNNQIKLYQFSEAISTVVIPENCYYLRASSNKTNTDLTIKYVGLNNFDETQQNKLESSSFQNFLTLVEGDEKGVITNSVQNLSLVFQNPLYYTLDKAGNVLISIDRDALFSQSENPTDDRYVTTVANSVQDILSSKNFKEGLSINGIEIVERNGFLYIKGNLATTGGITAYADDPDDPGSGGGLPGGGAIGDIVITGSGNALVDASLSEDHSVITFTKGWLVDAESDQSITGIKDFINGLKLDGQLIKIVDGVLFLDCSIAATGGITAYATMPGEGSSSIMDQLVVDTEYFIITEEGVLTIVPGSVGGISNIYVTGNGNALTTATLSEDGKTISFTKDKTFADDTEIKRIISEFKSEVNEQLKRFVTLDTEQEITAVKHFIEGVTIGSNKHKFYEKDGVLWLEGDIAITGGVTTYATENVDVSTIMDGVAVDEITITKGNDNVLRIKDAGAGSSFDENAMWSALASSSDKQINKSHLTTALTGYATESWVSQNYATSSALKSVSTKLNDFLEGSDTDTIINKWKELEAFLSGMAETDNLAEILETKADKSYVDSTFVTIATKQTITGEKTFSATLNTAAIKASGNITAPSLEASDYVTIAGIKFRKLENGAILVEGNLAATGGITGYAIDPVDVTTIMSGVVADEITITNDNGVLKIKNAGSGSGFDKPAMWTALAGSTTEQINKSHLTTALTGYATESWVSGKNYAVKATTLAGYGITDGINAVSVTGTGNAVTAASISGHTLTLTKGSTFSLSGHKHAWADITSGKPSTLSGYGITDAYTKTESDGRYPTKTGSGASGTWGINVTGNAGTATKLQTARTLWGRSFDGTKNVSGDINNVGNINFILEGKLVSNGSLELKYKNDDTISLTFTGTVFRPFTSAHNNIDLGASTARWRDLYIGRNAYVDGITKTEDFYIGGIRLHKTADGVITLEGNLAVTGGITTYAIDPVSASTIMDGVVVDGTTIKKENGKLVAVGGGEAGSVAWGNISGKPSVFSTNIANITDLHSSWDAVLKAQKPNWLTAVSIATISDLHANWDALLKAAPSAYVTRWPTISEVTNKQNLVIKLNGGTTEGTNQFTYNATAAKSLNITASSVGAAASSHNHSWSNITSGKPTTLAGYGITDAYTKTESDNRYLNVSGGDTIQGLITINHTTLDDSINIIREGSNNPTICFSNKTNGQLGRIGFNNEGKICVYFKTSSDEGYVWHSTNDGAGSGLDADLLDGTHKSDLLTALTSSSGTNISITVGGTTKSIADLYANSAYKLENTHTIWGQNFNGTQNITGRFTSNERVYADKGIWVTNNDIAGWGQSNAALNLSIPNTSNTSGIICVYRSGQSNIGYTRFFSMEISNSSDSVRTYYVNEVRIDITPTYMDINKQLNINGNTIIGSGGNLGIGTANPAAKLHVIGDILATGGGTYYGSDIRYKSIMQQVELSLLSIANAPSFVYRWNKKEMKRDRLNLGGSAQYTQSVLPWAVEEKDNFLSMDYATVAYTFAVHTARHLLTYETRTDKKIKKLENRVKYLEKQLKSLYYEEANIVDN